MRILQLFLPFCLLVFIHYDSVQAGSCGPGSFQCPIGGLKACKSYSAFPIGWKCVKNCKECKKILDKMKLPYSGEEGAIDNNVLNEVFEWVKSHVTLEPPSWWKGIPNLPSFPFPSLPSIPLPNIPLFPKPKTRSQGFAMSKLRSRPRSQLERRFHRFWWWRRFWRKRG